MGAREEGEVVMPRIVVGYATASGAMLECKHEKIRNFQPIGSHFNFFFAKGGGAILLLLQELLGPLLNRISR